MKRARVSDAPPTFLMEICEFLQHKCSQYPKPRGNENFYLERGFYGGNTGAEPVGSVRHDHELLHVHLTIAQAHRLEHVPGARGVRCKSIVG